MFGKMSNTLISSSSSGAVPKDGTVHELTSNTIWFIEHLNNHYDIIGVILQLQPDTIYLNQLETILTTNLNVQKSSAIGGSSNPDDRNKIAFGLYIKKILAELNLTILSKCDQYNDMATKYLFRLNNINYILKSLQQTALLDLVKLTEIDCERNYQELIQELRNSYQKSWSKLLVNISPIDDLPKPVNGKIVRDKERVVLKERFAMFNKELEDACKIQRGISVPDIILREGLKRDNAEFLIPQYNRFFEHYADVQFSKNPEKYIKYRPQDVSAMLNNLFDDRI